MNPLALAGATAGRLTHYAVSGVVGGLIIKEASKRLPQAAPVARRALVGSVAGGITAGRRLASAAEEARLRAGDVVAEARAGLGEEAPPPSGIDVEDHDHGHEH